MKTTAGVLVLLFSGNAYAGNYCENLDTQEVTVGEARYIVTSGTDESYANAYFDGGNELSLGLQQTAGKLASGADTTLKVSIYLADETTTDCKDVYFDLLVWGRNYSAPCSSSSGQVYLGFATFNVNTCGFGAGGFSQKYYGANMLAMNAVPMYSAYYYEIWSRNGATVTASDTGCFIANNSACQL